MNAERLKSLRTQKKISQKAIADYLGIDRTAYVKYESDVNNPNADRLRMLAEYFGVSIDYLMGENDKINQDTSKWSEPLYLDNNIKELVELFGKLSPSDQKNIKDIAELWATKNSK